MEIREALLEYIEENAGIRPADDLDFTEDGVFDSMGLVLLVAFIEEKFGLEIRPEDLTPENFRSVGTVVQLMKDYRRDT